MTSLRHTAASLASFRQDVEVLLSGQDSLEGEHVVLDCSRMRMAAPSFLDELIKRLFGEHRADQLTLVPVHRRTAELARRIAAAHDRSRQVHAYGTWNEFSSAT